jgi:hypothetical protein
MADFDLCGFPMSYKVLAFDEVAQKTDSSFVGDISNSMVNDSLEKMSKSRQIMNL